MASDKKSCIHDEQPAAAASEPSSLDGWFTTPPSPADLEDQAFTTPPSPADLEDQESEGSEEATTDDIIGKLDTYFEEKAIAASGKEASKWFTTSVEDTGDAEGFEQAVKLAVADVDSRSYEAYLTATAEDPGTSKTPEWQYARRNELTFLMGLLSGFRRRYVANEDSLPFSELDIRRYSMYSSKARRLMLDRLRTYLKITDE